MIYGIGRGDGGYWQLSFDCELLATVLLKFEIKHTSRVDRKIIGAACVWVASPNLLAGERGGWKRLVLPISPSASHRLNYLCGLRGLLHCQAGVW